MVRASTFLSWLALTTRAVEGFRPAPARCRYSAYRAAAAADDEGPPLLNARHAAWARGFQGIAQNPAFVDAYTSRQPLFLARAVEPSSAASTFGSAALVAAAQWDSSIPLGQVEWGANQGWNNARLADAAAAAQAFRAEGERGVPRGGVLMNDAGAAVPELALLCGLCMHAFQLPVGLNVYSTHAPLFGSSDEAAAVPAAAASGSGPSVGFASTPGRKTSGLASKGAKGFAARSQKKRTALPPAAAAAAAPTPAAEDAHAALTISNEARETPPHTDGQDVLAVATAGAKRWRVYARPPSFSTPARDPYNLGKDADCLRASTLGVPVVDAVLLPGDAIFVPAGFPHETFAVASSLARLDADEGAAVDEAAGPGAADPCAVHLTFGFTTLLWGLTFDTLRRVSEVVQTSGSGEDAADDERNLHGATGAADDDDAAALRARLQAPLPLGFVANRPALLAEARALAGARVDRAPGLDATEAASAAAAAAVVLVDDESLSAAASFLEHHCDTLVGLLTEAYAAASAPGAPPYAPRAKATEAAIAEVLENIIF